MLANRLTVPIAAYLFVTIVLPIANGAARRGGFLRHTIMVVVGCALVVGLVAAIDVVRNKRRGSRVGGKS